MSPRGLSREPLANVLSPSAGAYPSVTSNTSSYTYDAISSHLIWTTDSVSSEAPTGSLEFVVDLPEEDTNAFYPVQVGFVSAQSLAGVGVARAVAGDDEAAYSQSTVLSVDEFAIV